MSKSEDPLVARMELLGRSMLAAAGLTDAVIRKAYTRISEGLDATETKAFHSEGDVIYSQPMIAWTERRESAKEILKLADHYPSRLEHEFAGEVTFVVKGLNPEGV